MIQRSSNLLKVRRVLTLDHRLRTKGKKSVQPTSKRKTQNAKEINRKKIKQKLISIRIQSKAWYALIYCVWSTEKNGLKNKKKKIQRKK